MQGIDRFVGEPSFFRMNFAATKMINAQLLLESVTLIAD
jgi:hypothetical protein